MADKTTMPVQRDGRSLRRWDPFEMLEELQEELGRFWGEARPSATRPSLWTWRRPAATATTWAPRMDVFEKNGNLIVKAEIPGMKPEDIEVTLDEGDMIIRGERKAESEVKEESYYRMERSYGSFYRRLPLPAGIKPEHISATYANGVLEITIPKPIEQKPEPKKISVASK